MGEMDEIVREFLVESYENLDQLEQDMVSLESEPGSKELLSSIFRTIHTIKGLSLIHISEPTRLHKVSRMPSSA